MSENIDDLMASAVHFHMANSLLPDDGPNDCCFAAFDRGPQWCTCWEPVYDLEQEEPNLVAVPATRTTMCDDCACRPDSPERSGD